MARRNHKQWYTRQACSVKSCRAFPVPPSSSMRAGCAATGRVMFICQPAVHETNHQVSLAERAGLAFAYAPCLSRCSRPVSSLRSSARTLAAGSHPLFSAATKRRPRGGGRLWFRLAERAGFEPAVRCYAYDGLANRCFRPLSHLSGETGVTNRLDQVVVLRGIRVLYHTRSGRSRQCGTGGIVAYARGFAGNGIRDASPWPGTAFRRESCHRSCRSGSIGATASARWPPL